MIIQLTSKCKFCRPHAKNNHPQKDGFRSLSLPPAPSPPRSIALPRSRSLARFLLLPLLLALSLSFARFGTENHQIPSIKPINLPLIINSNNRQKATEAPYLSMVHQPTTIKDRLRFNIHSIFLQLLTLQLPSIFLQLLSTSLPIPITLK